MGTSRDVLRQLRDREDEERDAPFDPINDTILNDGLEEFRRFSTDDFDRGSLADFGRDLETSNIDYDRSPDEVLAKGWLSKGVTASGQGDINYGEQFITGLTFGRDPLGLNPGDPEGFGELGANLLGMLVSGVAVSYAAAFATPVIGATVGGTRLGSIAYSRLPQLAKAILPRLTRIGLEGGAIAALTPEDDYKQELALTAVADFLVNNPLGISGMKALMRSRSLEDLSTVYNTTIKKEYNVLLEEAEHIVSGKIGMAKKGETVTTPTGEKEVIFTKEADKRLSRVKKLTKDYDQVLKNKQKLFREASRIPKDKKEIEQTVKTAREYSDRKLDELIEATKQDPAFRNAAVAKDAKEQLKQTFRGLDSGLHRDGFDYIFESKLTKVFGEDTLATPGNRAILSEDTVAKINETVADIRMADINSRVGLRPDANVDETLAALKKSTDEFHKLIDDYKTSPTITNIQKNIAEELNKLIKDPTSLFTADFPKTAEALQILEGSQKVLADSTFTGANERVKDIVKQIGEVDEDVSTRIIEAAQKSISKLSTKSKEGIQEFQDALSFNSITDIPAEQRDQTAKASAELLNEVLSRGAIDVIQDTPQRAFKSEMEDLAKQVLKHNKDGNRRAALEVQTQMNQLKDEFAGAVLADPNVGRQVFDNIEDSNVRQAYLLFRALNGDTAAENVLTHMEKSRPFAWDRTLSARLAMNELSSSSGTIGRVPNANNAQITYLKGASDVNMFQRQFNEAIQVVRGIGRFSPDLQDEGYRVLDDLQTSEDTFIRIFHEDIRKKILEPFKASLRTVSPQEMEATLGFISELDVTMTKMERELLRKHGIEHINQIHADMETHAKELIDSQSEVVQDLYGKYRESMDTFLDMMNRNIDDYNLAIQNGELPDMEFIPRIPRRLHYSPRVWEGSHAVYRYDPVTNKTYNIGSADTNEQVVEILRKYRELHPNNNNFEVILEPRIIASTTGDVDTVAPWKTDIQKLYRQDARVINELLDKDELTGDTITQLFYGNKLRRSTDLNTYVDDVTKAMEMYAYSGMKWTTFLKSTANAEVFARRLERTAAPFTETIKSGKNLGSAGKRLTGTAEYFRTLANDLVGRPRDYQAKVDEVILGALDYMKEIPVAGAAFRQVFPEGGKASNALARIALTMGRLATIGFNVSTAMINTSLYATNVAALMPMKTAMNAMWKLKGALKPDSQYHHLLVDSNITLFQGGATLKEALDSPHLDASSMHSFLGWLDSVGMSMFNATEKWTRATTLIAARDFADDLSHTVAKKLAQEKPLTTRAEKLYEESARMIGSDSLMSSAVKDRFAKEFMLLTNHNFNKVGLTEAFRNTGLKPFLQFKTFMWKQLQFMFMKDLNPVEQFKVIGALGTIGGLASLPGLAYVDKIATAEYGYSPRRWMEESLGDTVAGGLPAALGVDMTGRMQIDDLEFFVGDEFYDIFGIAASNMKNAASKYMEGDTQAALSIMSPPALRNFSDSLELWTTGGIRSNFKNDPLAIPGDIDNPKQAALIKLLGFDPLEVSKLRRAAWEVQSHSRRVNNIKKQMGDQALKLWNAGKKDEARRLLKKYKISSQSFQQRLANDKLNRRDRLLQTSSRETRRADRFRRFD